jgi:hypothetical protein
MQSSSTNDIRAWLLKAFFSFLLLSEDFHVNGTWYVRDGD